jgi:hypothetical protein
MENDGGKKSSQGMEKAYAIASELMKDRLKSVNPEAYSEISSISKADVLVIPGRYDHIEQVLRISHTPFTLVNPHELLRAELRPDQIVFINCPGHFDVNLVPKLRDFVEKGGFLFTTDWALKNILEPAFPGFVRFNERATADEVVRIQILNTDDPFLKSMIGPHDDPQWWLEGSSYPIQILNKAAIQVLAESKEIEAKYGESPVFISFDYGSGKVYHMISHFYLQRSETRTQRHQSSAASYLDEKAIPQELRLKYEKLAIDECELSAVESAYTSSSIVGKVLFEKQMRMKKIPKEEKNK